jgi:Reverse transcriptase (RNA-dependent DNA polymerase)
LFHIFSRSIVTGTVPSKMKIAKVIPVYKSGDPYDINNYRPISLLCTFSKIFEKIVANRLTEYLVNNNLFSPSQFGFRAKHSTSHPMIHLLNKAAAALNSKKHLLIIFCDLRKAFNTCDVEILCKNYINWEYRAQN